MKCEKCGNDLFKITAKKSCTDCENNENGSAENDWECNIGTCFNEGCHMYTCAKCGDLSILPMRYD